MNQEVVFTSKQNVEDALKDLFSQLNNSPSQYKVVIFFAGSNYDFKELSEKIYDHFPTAQVLGTTTSGEICQKCFSNSSIVLSTISDASTKFASLLIEDADKFPIIYKEDIEKTASSVGIKIGQKGANRTSFAFALTCGLLNMEESVLALLNSTINDEYFQIAGGTAGDDLKFKETFVSCNGEVSNNGAAVLFVNTPKKFIIRKENIFKSVGRRATITDVESETRTILSINRQSPQKAYAGLLGVPESKVNDVTFNHPFGRVFGDDIFISSFIKFADNGTAQMYSRITPGTVVEVLEPIDELAEARKTFSEFKNEIPNAGCVLLVNCILRTVEFSQNKTTNQVLDIWKSNYSVFAGFSSYGEQINRLHSNQTLVALIIEA